MEENLVTTAVRVPLIRSILTAGAVAAVAVLLVVGAVTVRSANAATSVQMRYSALAGSRAGDGGVGVELFPENSSPEALSVSPFDGMPIDEADNARLLVNLPWTNARITSVRVCYQVVTDHPGSIFISETRLLDSTGPHTAVSRLVNGTDRTSTTSTCYSVSTGFTPSGTVTLSLKVVSTDNDNNSLDDRIIVGMIALSGTA
jgi:hypothetical protein